MSHEVHARGQRGQAMVEFALVGPFFLLLLFMIAEVALYVNALASVDNAAREGGRVAAICGSGIAPVTVGNSLYGNCQAAVQAAVKSHLGILPTSTAGSCGNNPCVVYTPGQVVGGTATVAVDYRYGFYVNGVIGTTPTTQIKSSATVVGQQ